MFRSITNSDRGAPWYQAVTGLAALTVVVSVALVSPATAESGETAGKWGGAIDADALQVLKGMTDYLASLEAFSLHTENTYEDVLETEQKFQFAFSSDVVVQRPDKLLVERTDGIADHLFLYDGEALSTYHVEDGFYAVVSAPDNLNDFLHFARDTLGLVPPAGDMLFTDAFELLTANITSGIVVGNAVVGGVMCDHLAFTSPLVDWQVWVAHGDAPLPYKYILTTKDDPAQPQFVTWMSNWEVVLELADGTFVFEAPASAIKIEYIAVP